MNKYVAISEEFANSALSKVKSGGLLFDRRVARIVTPGTLIDEKFMDPYENNYLLAIHLDQKRENVLPSGALPLSVDGASSSSHQSVGLAWLDLSTGDFSTQSTTTSHLASVVARIGPREIVIDAALPDICKESLRALVGHQRHLITSHPGLSKISPMSEWTPMLENAVTNAAEFTDEEVAAGSVLLQYVRKQLQGVTVKLQPPRRRQMMETMGIDRNSLRGLEILETARDGLGKGSLIHAVRRTNTKSGARLLRDRLSKLKIQLSGNFVESSRLTNKSFSFHIN